MNKSFVLKVDYSTGTANYIRQKFIEYDTERTISRVYDSSTSEWLQNIESVSKSDLSDYLYFFTVQDTYDFPANGQNEFHISYINLLPSDYMITTIYDSFAGRNEILIGNRYHDINNKSIVISARNVSGNSITSTVYARVLCTKK